MSTETLTRWQRFTDRHQPDEPRTLGTWGTQPYQGAGPMWEASASTCWTVWEFGFAVARTYRRDDWCEAWTLIIHVGPWMLSLGRAWGWDEDPR